MIEYVTKENIVNLCVISVESYEYRKSVHYIYDFQEEDKVVRTDYVGLYIPIDTLVKDYKENGVKSIYDRLADVKQYAEDCDDETLTKMVNVLNDGLKYNIMKWIDLKDLDRETPNGTYISELI